MKRPQRKPAGRGLRIEELFSNLHIGKQHEDRDGPEPRAFDDDPIDELDDQPRRIESWDQSSQAGSVGNPRCPHPGCREPITVVQNAAGRQVTCCGAHGVIQPIRDRARLDPGKHWGDGYTMAPWQPAAWWEPTRRSAPAMDTYDGIRVMRRKRPAPMPRYEPPIDPLDFGSG